MPFPLILADAASGTPSTFPTLAECYEAVGRQLGSFLRTTVSTTIPTGEPGRWGILDDLKDDEDERAHYAGQYFYVRSGIQARTQRRIRRQGYEGPQGAVALSRVLEDADGPVNLVAGVTVELTAPLPVIQIGSTRGLVEIIGLEALPRLWTEVRVSITGNGTSQYDLAGDSWLLTEAQVDGIYDWTTGIPTTEPPLRSAITPTITVDGATISLGTGYSYSTAATFQLHAFVPANRLVYAGSAWAYTSAPITDPSYQIPVPLKWVVPVAVAKAIQYCTRQIMTNKSLTKDEKAEQLAALPNRQSWARAAAHIIQERLPRPTAPPSQGLTSIASTFIGGPLVGGSGWPN